MNKDLYAFLAGAALTLAASFPAVAAKATAPTGGYRWGDPILVVQPGVGQALFLRHGDCLPFVTRRATVFCLDSTQYATWSSGEPEAYQANWVEIGLDGVVASRAMNFATGALALQVLEPMCAAVVGSAIMSDKPGAAESCLPAVERGDQMYRSSMSSIDSEGAISVCITAQYGDACTGKGAPEMAAVQKNHWGHTTSV